MVSSCNRPRGEDYQSTTPVLVRALVRLFISGPFRHNGSSSVTPDQVVMSSSSTLETACPPEEPQNKSEEPVASEKWSIVEFEGVDDRWDPKNFSKLKKWLCLASVTHGAVVVTCASSLYVPLRLRALLIA